MSTRILFVLAADDAASREWIARVADLGYEAHVFATREGRRPDACRGAIFWDAIPDDGDESRGIAHASSGLGSGAPRAEALTEVIRRARPALVHSLEPFAAGELVREARTRLSDALPAWLVTLPERAAHLSFHLPDAEARVRAVLEACDACLCERDADAARLESLGYRGPRLPSLPRAEGFEPEAMDALRAAARPSRRRIVRLDGGQDWSRRASTGLRALALSARFLRGYRILVDRPGEDVGIAAGLLARSAGLDVTTLDDEAADELRGCAAARVSLGLSLADAAGTGLFESMAAGALPLQSATSAAADWVRDGETGLLVPPEDPGVVALALQRALTDDALVDEAAVRNARTIGEQLDRRAVRAALAATYETALGAARPRQLRRPA